MGGIVKIEPRRISGYIEGRCRVCGRIWKICPETWSKEEVGGGGGMTSIALVDLRENNGHVVAIVDDNENIVQFDNFDEIEKLKGNHPLSGFPWLAVDIDSEICWCMEEVK
jgi:hypothetical protein